MWAAVNQINPAARRVKILAEADPGALARILQPFQILNVVPISFHAQRVGATYLEVTLELAPNEVPSETARLVVAKLAQLPAVMAAVSCD